MDVQLASPAASIVSELRGGEAACNVGRECGRASGCRCDIVTIIDPCCEFMGRVIMGPFFRERVADSQLIRYAW